MHEQSAPGGIADLDIRAGLSASDRRARGEAAARAVPHESLALAPRPADHGDAIAQLERQAATRVTELIPLRHGRMVASPFACFRGAAAVMASDLAAGPSSGLIVQLCGDAHLSNFGLYQSPERRLVFDCNDFDETLPGPFEWDVKRLVTSIEIAARENGYSPKARRRVVLATVARYRQHLVALAARGNLAVWYSEIDFAEELAMLSAQLSEPLRKRMERTITRARTHDSAHAYAKLTTVTNGRRRIVSDPPLIMRAEELLGPDRTTAGLERFRALLDDYATTVRSGVAELLHQYRLVDLARYVVGVGSVGTWAWIGLFVGLDDQDPLFLQFKEAQPSVLEEHLGRSRYAHCGARVVNGQLLMQASSDIFLGWMGNVQLQDGVERDYYVRQLRDGKFSFRVDQMDPEAMNLYGRGCATALARAHACSGDRVALAAYVGDGSSFDAAMAEFAVAYADRNEADYGALRAAVDAGTLTVIKGI